ncbi:hypothetical protein D5086_017313 [Populus alba]|uniref:Uncharacterized protein n=1 Tax=Populus alba TaxID=43335 RepID=A0ACC4BY77_POPAL
MGALNGGNKDFLSSVTLAVGAHRCLSLVASAVGANGCILYSGNSDLVVRLRRDLFSKPGSGQDPEAFCLVGVVLYCYFFQSSLLHSLKLDASFGALFATGLVDLLMDFHCLWLLLSLVLLIVVLGVVVIYSLVSKASFFLKAAGRTLQVVVCCCKLSWGWPCLLGENVGLLLSPCSEADFVVHRRASCFCAQLQDRLLLTPMFLFCAALEAMFVF